MTQRIVRSCLAVLALTTALTAQSTWLAPNPGMAPGLLFSAATGTNPITGGVMVFGGWANSLTSISDQLWRWNPINNNWTLAATGGAPASYGHVMATAGFEVVLFGGAGANGLHTGTWFWSPIVNSWVNAVPTVTPPSRVFAHMSSFLGGTALLYGGGVANNQPGLADTWQWSRAAGWQQINTANSPGPRVGGAMAFDECRGVAVLFGGRDAQATGNELFDTWEFDGADWSQVATTRNPPAVLGAKMAYDSRRQVMVLFGGLQFTPSVGVPTSTWEFNGTDWTESSVAGVAPAGRFEHALAYDSATGSIVVFGGQGLASPGFADTWTLDASSAATRVAFGIGCSDRTGRTMRATQRGLPVLGESPVFRVENAAPSAPVFLNIGFSSTTWAGFPLPFALLPLGGGSCRVVSAIDVSASSIVNVRGVAEVSLPITNTPALLGLTFFDHWVAISPAANRLGVVLSDAGQNRIGG